MNTRPYIPVTLIAGATILADQVSKLLICSEIALHERLGVIPGLLDIVHVRNTGVAFGLFRDAGSRYRTLFMLLISAIALVLIGVLVAQLRRGQRMETFSLSLILGGAIGNLIDRCRLGEVIDFIDVYLGRFHWPAFNVADSAITVGIGLYLYCELFRHRRTRAGEGNTT